MTDYEHEVIRSGPARSVLGVSWTYEFTSGLRNMRLMPKQLAATTLIPRHNFSAQTVEHGFAWGS
jgi:hypothetical protein